jgi:uncharacterized protein (DUF2267 family)
MGGSAFAMAQQISEGVILVTERTFRRLQIGEMDKLAFELDKKLREIRSEQPDLADTKAIQQRNRTILRLRSALQMLRSHLSRRRR